MGIMEKLENREKHEEKLKATTPNPKITIINYKSKSDCLL